MIKMRRIFKQIYLHIYVALSIDALLLHTDGQLQVTHQLRIRTSDDPDQNFNWIKQLVSTSEWHLGVNEG